MQHTLASPNSRFQIEQKEGSEDIVGNKARQPEVQNGNRLVLVDMVGLPMVNQLIEALILYAPARMSQFYDCFGARPVW